jgi:hypothetical protein
VVDLYAWSVAHPPLNSDYFIPGGYTYAMQSYERGFLVTDAHHNRVLKVGLTGAVSVFKDFNSDVVPTGLDRAGRTVVVAQAGPVPHLPSTGRVVALRRPAGTAVELATGAPLLVDVEVAHHTLYGLAQGFWPYAGQEGKEGYPAAARTGLLMRADRNGHFQPLVSGLDRPTTFEIIGDSAYVITITGKVIKVAGLGDHGHHSGTSAAGS